MEMFSSDLGLCGNYNMVLADDMRTPQGIVEGTVSSFGNSWKTNPTCLDRKERLENPCSLSVETGTLVYCRRLHVVMKDSSCLCVCRQPPFRVETYFMIRLR